MAGKYSLAEFPGGKGNRFYQSINKMYIKFINKTINDNKKMNSPVEKCPIPMIKNNIQNHQE